ncbi:MAG: metal-dependent transcriptional regulator [Ignavibacteria bacterium]|nr:metal-dependent transcriptional regulator [Ignavibacteria bacterium]
MVPPLEALIIGTAVLGLCLFVVWPRKGLIARFIRVAHDSQQVRVEDALKHLYDCEYRNLVCTRQSLCGALSISGDESAKLLSQLEDLRLLVAEGDGFSLTDEGRSYALRIIRMHRLWERYLADETGLDEIEWHREAEAKEHLLTVSDANALAERMGNPRFDPHGDPIPTQSGEIPGSKGIPASRLSAGDIGEITHIEDEPDVVFAQITALGLTPGMRIRIMASDPKMIRLESDGIESVLAPSVAANITVQRLSLETPVEGPYDSLAMLRPGETGRVVGISKTCRGLQRRRLLDLGIIPGTRIRAEMTSVAGDPTSYRIRGAAIALRKSQAGLVKIEREKGATS